MKPRLFIALLLLVLLTLPASWAQPPKRNPNPGVLPPHAEAYGFSYGEWGALWWMWAGDNGFLPVVDPTGEFADLGQEGPVWFLAGNFGGVSVREVTVPAGKGLFFPLLNVAANASPFFDEWYPDGITDDELRDVVNQFMDVPGIELTCTINGRELQNLEEYRGDSPVFEFFGFNAVSDGYWILLPPLPPGEHVIHFTGFIPAFDWISHGGDLIAEIDDFELDVTYFLTVAPGKK